MSLGRRSARAYLLCGAAMSAVISMSGVAKAEDSAAISIPAQSLATALNTFGVQTGRAVMFKPELAAGKQSAPVSSAAEPEVALNELLSGTGLSWRRQGDLFLIEKADADPQGGGAAGDGAEVDALIVTAQKREEDIQDVPIAISAFSQEDLTTRQVAGGPDLITQIPNFSFTKTNFTSYSIQIRGIGTQAISATTDPAVAVAFNNTPFVRNRFFEQEFYDLERLEVLRGPQGTLYGRNATAGVVNIISAKPKFTYEAKLSGDVGNYSATRIEGMINIPLVEDAVALRLAGAWTKRQGYAFNQMTGRRIDGRDLWSTRVSLRFEPTDWITANLIWEHFEENDDRLRSGKQLCKKHVVTEVGGKPTSEAANGAEGGGAFGINSYVSQGCAPGVSLYSPEAFQTPNGYALPFYGPTSNLGNFVFPNKDPYLNGVQSRDLRVIESSVEPDYRAMSDLGELQIAVDLGDHLTLSSETSYSTDSLASLQDYNRFTTTPGAFNTNSSFTPKPGLLEADGAFCDPQLGCSDRLLLVDLSTSDSSQFSQEFRLGSDFDGPLNFSLGANFLRHDAFDKYYVFINSLTMFLAKTNQEPAPWVSGVSDNSGCFVLGPGGVGDTAENYDPEEAYGVSGCAYIDPNPIESLNDEGRNYFLSKNPYRLISYAGFGEVYYNVTPDLKLTGGLRWTVDKKQAPQIRSWLLAVASAGPYPVSQIVEQEWNEPTGRLAIDWKPDLGFTDETLIYASYAHGYKAGGANPPPPVFATYSSTRQEEELPDTFGPEFVDAFEIGAKNTLFDSALTLNLTAFYYDYKGYQTSEIRNRAAVNSNFDAEVWGLEVEADWRATEALRLGFKGGYNGTRMADGSRAIDLMDRTAGNPDWIVVRPFPTIPSNCVLPVHVAIAGDVFRVVPSFYNASADGACVDAYYSGFDPVTGVAYVPNPTVTRAAQFPVPPGYPGWNPLDESQGHNGGRGFFKDLSGNELPNAPEYTATVTVDYTMPLPGEWLLTFHGDYHYQAASWGRVFNSDPYDRIRAFSTMNFAGIFTNEDAGWKVMAYVKNVLDETAITGTFLNSDDTGLTTNVFLTEPRLYGLRVIKDFTGGGWLGGFGEGRGGPYPFTVEIGGGTSRFVSDNEVYAPDWEDDLEAGSVPPVQDQDLDWNDSRSVKLTYAPSNSGWRASAAYRFGKTNGYARSARYEDVPDGIYARTFYGKYTTRVVEAEDNHWRGASRDTEEHTIIDFMVGKDLGMGVRDLTSTLSAGLRRVELGSTSRVSIDGLTGSYVEPLQNVDLGEPNINHHAHFVTSLESDRSFEGTGPTVTWDASARLWGNEDSGHADLDWSLTGGVLFGKQEMQSSEDRLGLYYFGGGVGADVTFYDEIVPRSRTEDVTVPNLSVTLGISYAIDRVKVSTGYSYDRFFDAIDGGIEEAQQYDRTVHGPYLKLSLGFGG